jgi:hypothetical protein
MLKLPVYLYPNTYELILDLDDNQRIHRTMYQRDLKVQKGLKNKIQLQFKNSDQKAIPIAGKSFVFSMFDATNQRLMIQKTVEVLDQGTTSTRGLALLTLNEGDTWGLDSTSYNFGIRMLEDDGTYTPAYANTYYGMNGTLHIVHELMPALQPSQEITAFQKHINRDPGNGNFIWDSDNIYANPSFHSHGEYHTMAFYLTNYSGTIYTQGSLDNNPPPSGNPSTFANIDVKTYSHFTGIDYVNFQGPYTYVRVTHIPESPISQPGRNDLTEYTGTFDKLVYRS